MVETNWYRLSRGSSKLNVVCLFHCYIPYKLLIWSKKFKILVIFSVLLKYVQNLNSICVISNKLAPRPIKSISCNVCTKYMYTFLSKLFMYFYSNLQGWKSNQLITKIFLGGKLWQNIGFRIFNFGSEMILNCCTENIFFLGPSDSLLMGLDPSKMAIGVSDMWHVIPDTWHLICVYLYIYIYIYIFFIRATG